MECMKLFGLDFSLGLDWKVIFLLFLLLLFFFFLIIIFFFFGLFCLFFTFGCFRISLLFTWAHSKPFWKLGLWPLCEFCKFFLPGRFQCFGPQNFSSSFIKLLPISICPCIRSALIL